MQQLGNLVGAVLGVALVAVLAAKPQVVSNFFNGVSGVTRAAVSPVTGR